MCLLTRTEQYLRIEVYLGCIQSGDCSVHFENKCIGVSHEQLKTNYKNYDVKAYTLHS